MSVLNGAAVDKYAWLEAVGQGNYIYRSIV